MGYAPIPVFLCVFHFLHCEKRWEEAETQQETAGMRILAFGKGRDGVFVEIRAAFLLRIRACAYVSVRLCARVCVCA